MQLSYKNKPHNDIDYFPLPNGYADVFLHKNKSVEIDVDGGERYVAEEVYFQIEQSVTKEYIEENFELMWSRAETGMVEQEPTLVERIQLAEDAILLLLRGKVDENYLTQMAAQKRITEEEKQMILTTPQVR